MRQLLAIIILIFTGCTFQQESFQAEREFLEENRPVSNIFMDTCLDACYRTFLCDEESRPIGIQRATEDTCTNRCKVLMNREEERGGEYCVYLLENYINCAISNRCLICWSTEPNYECTREKCEDVETLYIRSCIPLLPFQAEPEELEFLEINLP